MAENQGCAMNVPLEHQNKTTGVGVSSYSAMRRRKSDVSKGPIANPGCMYGTFTYLEPETSIYKCLFQLEHSKSLHSLHVKRLFRKKKCVLGSMYRRFIPGRIDIL